MDKPTLLAALRSALAGRSDVRLALLFGSRVRGTHRPDSDVDLAVLTAPGADLLAISAELRDAVSLEVDLVPLSDASIPLLSQVINEGELVHECPFGTASAWRTRVLIDLETDRPWFTKMRDSFLRRVAEKGV
ncbi:MAG TPA: nucleotidyltransferase domain-containing protein [Polyangiaceae bacterium]|nr:nucleotidyltransferase domain-containing protein [Polyangiaceae bacterium]